MIDDLFCRQRKQLFTHLERKTIENALELCQKSTEVSFSTEIYCDIVLFFFVQNGIKSHLWCSKPVLIDRKQVDKKD